MDYRFTLYIEEDDIKTPAYDADSIAMISMAMMLLLNGEEPSDKFYVYDNFEKKQITSIDLFLD